MCVCGDPASEIRSYEFSQTRSIDRQINLGAFSRPGRTAERTNTRRYRERWMPSLCVLLTGPKIRASGDRGFCVSAPSLTDTSETHTHRQSHIHVHTHTHTYTDTYTVFVWEEGVLRSLTLSCPLRRSRCELHQRRKSTQAHTQAQADTHAACVTRVGARLPVCALVAGRLAYSWCPSPSLTAPPRPPPSHCAREAD